MSNFLFINTSFSTNLNSRKILANLRDNFIFLIHEKFEELKDKPIHEIQGGKETLFYSGVEQEYIYRCSSKIKDVDNFMKTNFNSYNFGQGKLIKIKKISKRNGRQFSLLSVLYIHKSEYFNNNNNNVSSKKNYDENHLFFLFPILFEDLHKK